MAALTYEVRAACVDARRLRHQAAELKLKAHGNVARSRTRLCEAQIEADRARVYLVELLPSPSSDLRWTRSYEMLDETLVPLP